MDDFNPTPRLPTTSGERRVVWVLALLFSGLFAAEIAHNFTNQRLSILFVALFWGPALVLHELGHAWAARLVGWQVSEIVIGFGRELFCLRHGQTLIRVRMLPIEGYIVPNPTNLEHARFKSAFIYAAGPGVELLAIAALWLWLGPALTEPSTSLSMIAIQSAALALAMGALFNLLPYATRGGTSDGLGVLLSLLSPSEGFRSRLAAPVVRQTCTALYRENFDAARAAVDAGLQRYPEDWQLQGRAAVVTAALGDGRAAFDQLETLGHPDDKPAHDRVELLLDAAWVTLLAGERSLLPEAKAACERALEAAPGHPRAQLLLGQVFLESGHPEEAYRSLMEGYSATRDSDEEAQLVAYLAIACRRANKHDYADRFKEQLTRYRLGPALCQRVSKEFA